VNTLALPPYPGSYWVVPNRLLAGACPGRHDHDSLDDVLSAILDAGVRSVINLMDEEERESVDTEEHYLPYEDRLEQMAEERGSLVEIQGYAIEASAGAMPTPQEMELILDAIDAEIDGRDSPTLVHCSDGNGRTALVVGCYLARHGIASGKDAIERIRELRAHDPALAEQKSPESMVHERFITRWKEGQ
jgi:hypothetical protein